MIDETLRKLEARIRSAERTSEDSRSELLALVGELRTELTAISETHSDDAASLARHTHDAATGTAAGVEESVREFESAHPRIVGLLRSLFQTLADAGI